VRDDYGKLYFEIIDYTGSAVERFADPGFDGYPALATQEEIDAAGEVKPGTEEILQAEELLGDADMIAEPPQKPLFTDDEKYVPRKYFVDIGYVEIVANIVYELDPNGNRLRVINYTEFTAEVVSSMYTTAADLRSKWSDAEQRAAVIAALESRGVALDVLLDLSGQPDADPFDLLCHIAFQSPLRTRRERSDYLMKEQREFFEKFSPEAREILNEILEKYVELGIAQFKMPEVFYLPPLIKHGNIVEISKKFGGTEKLRVALANMQTMLYAA
jgi:type I restriction enzyme R subunit